MLKIRDKKTHLMSGFLKLTSKTVYYLAALRARASSITPSATLAGHWL